MNELMQMFWHIVNHEDAVQVKFEIAKGLAKFTKVNTKIFMEEKDKMIKEISNNNNVEESKLGKEAM